MTEKTHFYNGETVKWLAMYNFSTWHMFRDCPKLNYDSSYGVTRKVLSMHGLNKDDLCAACRARFNAMPAEEKSLYAPREATG